MSEWTLELLILLMIVTFLPNAYEQNVVSL